MRTKRKIKTKSKMKTKTIIAVVVILIATVGVVAFTIKKKGQQDSINQASTQQGENFSRKIKDEDMPKEFSTVFVEGQVIGFKDGKLEIKNGEIDNKISAVENVFVYAKKGEKIAEKNTEDLSRGTNVKVEIETRHSKVVSIEILN